MVAWVRIMVAGFAAMPATALAQDGGIAAILPRDLMSLQRKLRLDTDNPYYARLRATWASRLEQAVRSLPKFDWETMEET